jgi:uncharacterized protein (TIGR02757 family)
MLSAERAERLRPLLDGFLAGHDPMQRFPNDPVELVHRYDAPADIEVAGLLCASLAYGRVDLFKPVLARLLDRMGPSPADFCASMSNRREWAGLEDLVYRFNRGADLGCLLWACGEAQREHGSLGALFAQGLRDGDGSLHDGLERFTSWLRGRDFGTVRTQLGRPRALEHLLPTPSTGGACKRLNLFLRWMVRSSDGGVDFGIWRKPALPADGRRPQAGAFERKPALPADGRRPQAGAFEGYFPPSLLVIPLDTHIARMARNLGLTARRDLSWRTAEEITASLRLLDPLDPIKYDFALCHFGMSGACPPQRHTVRCVACELRSGCGPGSRIVRLRSRHPKATAVAPAARFH